MSFHGVDLYTDAMTVAYDIWEEAKKLTFKLMRYVTYTVIQPFRYMHNLFSLLLISPTPSFSLPIFS